ncbi:hypothetical protein MHM87_19670, partial [Alteromonas sp. Cnat3-28]|uniref:hypothetical protein n=1 Tax=Alteromonas sp. Cnat3-28 TaxID=2917729 RepID=UPI001EF5FD3C
ETDQIQKHRKLKPHSFNKLCLLTLENPFRNLFIAPLFLVNLTPKYGAQTGRLQWRSRLAVCVPARLRAT